MGFIGARGKAEGTDMDFKAINSEPNEDVLQLVCFFEYQEIGAEFSITIKPVLDLLVMLSPA